MDIYLLSKHKINLYLYLKIYKMINILLINIKDNKYLFI